jgi:transcriptional regulator with XRE-family HTH domain
MTHLLSVIENDNIVSVMALLLKQWRERRGWSLRQLGERSGVSFVNILHIESGKADPRLSTLQRLAQALGISVRDLLPAGQRRTRRRQR